MVMMTLDKLMADLAPDVVVDPMVIAGLSDDSRHVKTGDLFCAYPGEAMDGRCYIADAIESGAVAVVAEAQNWDFNAVTCNVPVILVDQLAPKVALIAARFYQNPSKKINVVGVTGTNGKTSFSHLLAMSLDSLGQSCGVIGTMGWGVFPSLTATGYTTPGAIDLQRYLAELVARGVDSVVIEVSSHSIAQHRIEAIQFDYVVFTNLTRDHLDYHANMAEYAATKQQLFFKPGIKAAVINVDDAFGKSLVSMLKNKYPIYPYSLLGQDASKDGVYPKKVRYNLRGCGVDVVTPLGSGSFKNGLLGSFNVENQLAVLSCLLLMDFNLEDSLSALTKLKTVPGRMEMFGGNGMPMVVVDYAHTPDAIQHALQALRGHCKGKLWCVFGCGGDRDKGKRSEMGKIVEQFSDHIIVTNDNPRTESADVIVNDIISGMICPWAIEVVYERQAAIAQAVSLAAEHDIVLLAGKGHERYQDIQGERYPFDDRLQVQEQLSLKASFE